MLKMMRGSDLLFYDFNCTDYSTLSDDRVVGTIDLLKSDKGPVYVHLQKKPFNLQVTSQFLAKQQNNTTSLYCTTYDVGLELVLNAQLLLLNKTTLTMRDQMFWLALANEQVVISQLTFKHANSYDTQKRWCK